MKFKVLLSFIFLCWSLTQGQAQSTAEEVYTILQTKCLGCHEVNAGQPTPAGNLDLSGTPAQVYARLFEQDPTNPEALSKNYKLIDAGYPDRSFLYRKINDELYAESIMSPAEGNTMPSYQNPLSDQEKEIIRQWIYFGAPTSGTVVDKATIDSYYTNGGLPRVAPPPAPPAGEGFQLHLGSIFLSPGEEREYIYKYELQNDEAIEIQKVEAVMNSASHHFLFFKFNEGEDADEDEGLEEVTTLSTITGDAIAITNDTKMIGGWAYDKLFELPANTGYSWEDSLVLKFNYHVKNYDPSQIMPADVYVNIYTQPVGTAEKEMRSTFELYNPGAFVIFPGEQTFTWNLTNLPDAGSEDSIRLWSIAAHTHSYGTDFDVYLRNPDGSKGAQIYEGFSNFDHTFNQGYYSYDEPPLRIIDDYISFKEGDGLILEAKYNNTSGGILTFGLTTEDEMFGVFLQYVVDKNITTAVEDIEEEAPWAIYPNPTRDIANVFYNLEKTSEVKLEVFNLQGQLLKTLVNTTQSVGSYQEPIHAKELGMTQGVYLVNLTINGEVRTKKVVEIN